VITTYVLAFIIDLQCGIVGTRAIDIGAT